MMSIARSVCKYVDEATSGGTHVVIGHNTRDPLLVVPDPHRIPDALKKASKKRRRTGDARRASRAEK